MIYRFNEPKSISPKFQKLVKFVLDDTEEEFQRLMKEENLTEDEAAKVVVWGNKEGK